MKNSETDDIFYFFETDINLNYNPIFLPFFPFSFFHFQTEAPLMSALCFDTVKKE